MPEENSRAFPARCYGDPAKLAELNELDVLGCRACEHALVIWGHVQCVDARNVKQIGVPRVGHKCRFFELKG